MIEYQIILPVEKVNVFFFGPFDAIRCHILVDALVVADVVLSCQM